MMMSLKGTVAGRFLWQLGTKTVDRLGLPSLQNCAFTVVDEPIRPFTWAFEMLMLGSGVGYNIQREHVYQLPKVRRKVKIENVNDNGADFIVPDVTVPIFAAIEDSVLTFKASAMIVPVLILPPSIVVIFVPPSLNVPPLKVTTPVKFVYCTIVL